MGTSARAVAEDRCAQKLDAPAVHFEQAGQYRVHPDYALNILSSDLAQGLQLSLPGFVKPSQEQLNDVTLVLMGLYAFENTQAMHYYRDLQSSIRRDHPALEEFAKKWEVKSRDPLKAAERARLKADYDKLIKAYREGVPLDLVSLQRDVDQVVAAAVANGRAARPDVRANASRLARDKAFLSQLDLRLVRYARAGLCVTTAALNAELLLLAGSAPGLFERIRYETDWAFSSLIERIMAKERKRGEIFGMDPRYGTSVSRVVQPLQEELAAVGVNANLISFDDRGDSEFVIKNGEVAILAAHIDSSRAVGHAFLGVAYDPATKVLTYLEPNTPNLLRTARVEGKEIQDEYLQQLLGAGARKVLLDERFFFRIHSDWDAIETAQRLKIRDYLHRDIDLRIGGGRTSGRILSIDTKRHTIEFAPAAREPVQVSLLSISGIELRGP